MTTDPFSSADTGDREIITTRLIHAPRERVWDAWTKLEHLIHWWGPNGFTNTFDAFDLRVGGIWKFVMHGPDGTDYDNVVIYKEIIEPERLVYDHGESEDSIEFRSTVTFEDQDADTLVTMKAVFASAAIREMVVKEHGAIEGGKQTLAKLEEYVGRM